MNNVLDNKINGKKAQFKIQQMSFMLIALVIFFVIVGLFFVVISNANLRQDYEIIQRNKAITTISKLAETPELNCGMPLCVDADKLLVIKENSAFDSFWEVDGLIVRKVYPYTSGEKECNIGNYESCNTFTLRERPSSSIGSGTSSYVSLCRVDSKDGNIYDKCELAQIIVYLERE
jgi:hypothetical protein